MADYNLGRAEASIVFKTDERGFRRAEGSMDDLGDSAQETGKKFDKSAKSVTGFEKATKRAAGVTDEMARKQSNLNKVQDQATKSASSRKQAEKELKDVLADSAATEGQVAAAIQKRNSAVGQALKDAKELKKAQRELNNEIHGIPDVDPGGKNARQMRDMSSASKTLSRDLKKVGGDLGKLSKLTVKAGAIGGAAGIGGLIGAGGVGATVQTITGIVGAISEMSGALGVLPAALSSVGFSFGALKVATLGFGDAFDAIGDPEKFAEALGELSANAQQLMIQFNALKPSIDLFRYAIQDVFSAGLDKIVGPLAQTYLPMIQQGMEGVAGAANSAIKDLADWAQQSGVIADVKTFLDNNTAAMQNLAAAARPVADAVLDIVTVGSDFLPGLAGDIKDVATEFRDWIQMLRDTGQLHEWMQTGIDAVKQFGSVLANFGSSFMQIMNIGQSTGGGLLDFLEKISKELLAWVESADGQNTITQFFTSMKQATDALMPVMKPLLGIFVGLMSTFADLGTAMAPEILTFFNGLNDTFKTLGPQLVAMAPALGQALLTLGEAFSKIVIAIGPKLPELAQAMADFLIILADIATALAEDDWSDFGAGLLRLVGFFKPVLQVIALVPTTLADAAGKIPEILSSIGGFFTNLWNQITGGFQVAVEGIKNFFSNLWGQIKGGLQVAIDGLIGFVSTLASKGIELGRSLVQGMIDGIGSLVGSVVQKIRDLGGNIVDTVKDVLGIASPSKVFHEIGVNVGEGFIGGITSTEGNAKKATSSLADSAVGGMDTAYDDNDRKGIHGFVEDMLQLTGFGSKLVGLFKDISEKVFEGIKLATTDLKTGKSTIPNQWVRDPKVSEDDLRRAREDKAYSDAISEARKASTDTGNPDQRQGSLANNVPIIVNSDGTISSPDPAWDALIKRESGGRNVRQGITDANSGGNEAEGYFQITPETWKAMGGDKYTPSAITATPQQQAEIAANILRANPSGSDWGAGLPGRENASDLLAGLGKIVDDVKTTPPRAGSGKGGGYGLPAGTNTGGYGTGNSDTFPPWVMALAERFNIKPSTYGGHQESNRDEAGYAPNPQNLNRGIDWSGSIEDMQKFADFLKANAANMEGLEQIIWENPNTGERVGLGGRGNPTTGYYPDSGEGSYAEHRDHVHTRQNAPLGLPVDSNGAVPVDLSNSGTPGWMAIPAADPRQQAIQDNAAALAAPDAAGLSNALGRDLPADATMVDGVPMVTGPDGRLAVFDDGTKDSLSVQDDILTQLRTGDPNVDKLLTLGADPNTPENQIPEVLSGLDTTIAGLTAQDTPASRAQAEALKGSQSDIAGSRGFSAQNPVDQASGMLSAGVGVAQDVIEVINGYLKSVDAASSMTSTLVRGIENTEDIMKLIDNYQVFVDTAAKIFAAAGSITSMVGSFTGGSDFGGTSAAGSILSMVSGIISAVNTGIDMAQEGYKIVTKYVGKFLSHLLGAGQGDLMGDIKFLLDLNDNTLKRWSEDNPEDKRESSIPGWMRESNPDNLNQTRERTPDLNLYIGPGTDPNDAMNAAMWELRTGGSGAFAYADY